MAQGFRALVTHAEGFESQHPHGGLHPCYSVLGDLTPPSDLYSIKHSRGTHTSMMAKHMCI